MKNRKTVVVAFLLVAVLLLGVGYAALTDTLTIIGNAHIDLDTANKTFDERIYFSAAVVDEANCTGTGTSKDVASYTPDDATFTSNALAIVGEKSTFVFTITNDSNVDALISVNAKKLSGDNNPTNSNTEKFDVTYTYEDGKDVTNVANTGVVAGKGGTITITVVVTLKESVTSATSASFGLELTATSVDV